MRRIVVQKLNIGHQRGASKQTFKKIVAKQQVLGHAPGQRGFESIYVIQPFSCVAAFAK
jgi:hypothetical protein